MARPTKLTPETQKRIVDALRAGNTRRAAAEYGGVSETRFYDWMKRDGKEFREFREAVTRAESECEVENVAVLKKAAQGYDAGEARTKTRKWTEVVNGKTIQMEQSETITVQRREFDWRASLEWLKRRRRADWGDSIDIRKLDDETLLRLLNKDSTNDE